MATDQKLNPAEYTSKQALAQVLWSAIVEFFHWLFWSLLGLFSQGFRFLHELCERLIAMKPPVGPLDAEQFNFTMPLHGGVTHQDPDFPEQNIVNSPVSPHKEIPCAPPFPLFPCEPVLIPNVEPAQPSPQAPIPPAATWEIPRFSSHSGMMHCRKSGMQWRKDDNLACMNVGRKHNNKWIVLVMPNTRPSNIDKKLSSI